MEGGKPENAEKKEQGENQQQTQAAYGNGPESNPGYILREASALTTAPSLLPSSSQLSCLLWTTTLPHPNRETYNPLLLKSRYIDMRTKNKIYL